MAIEDGQPRRRMRRVRSAGRGSAGFSSNVSDGTQTYGSDVADDNPDLNEEVIHRAMELGENTPVQEFTPQSRMEEVRTRGGAYEREYRLTLLHRMLMRRVPLDEIAKELDVSVSTIKNDRTELYHRLRKEAKSLDINKIVGDTLGFYAEVRGMSMRTASVAKLPMNIRLGALRTALSSKNDEHRFLHASGVFDVLRYKATDNDSGDDITKLMQLTQHIMSTSDDMELSQTMDGIKDLDFSLDDEDDEDIRLFN
jgi:hypothetical protein